MNFGLEGRVAIVTGSSRGIGWAIARGMAEEGAKVTICARHKDAVAAAGRRIETLTGTDVLPVRADLQVKSDIVSLVNSAMERFGRIDILVNNTGGPPAGFFLETTEHDWREAVDSLLMSVIHCCREVIPHMKENNWGRIVNMASFAAKQPTERLVLSNTVRAGIFGLTKTISNELAEQGILVNSVCPGWTLTQRVEELARSKAEETEKDYEAVIKEWASDIPLKRLAEPEEIANLVVFLCSEKASYITGSVMQVDGGFIKSLL